MKKLKNLLKKRDVTKFGHYTFLLGIFLVLLFTLSDPTKLSVNSAILLLVLGLFVGLIDVPKKEANSFILATIAIIVASLAKFEQITFKLSCMTHPLGLYIKGLLLNASVFLSLAMLIVALKIIYRVYKE
jgi:hypothetical protein